MRCLPGLERIGLVEPADVHDLLPEPRERRVVVEVGEAEPGPGQGRVGDDRPVDRALVDDRVRLLDARQLVAAGALRVEPVERARDASCPG